jgi:hypothetical protein
MTIVRSHMKFLKLALVPLILLATMFCGYGALASLEPTDTSSVHWGWLIFYSLVGTFFLFLAAWLVWSAFRHGLGGPEDWDDLT